MYYHQLFPFFFCSPLLFLLLLLRYHIETKELEALGWSQEIDFETGLAKTKGM